MMDAERFAQLKAVLVKAASLLAPERPAFLDDACAGDPDLRKAAETLLGQLGGIPTLLATGGLESPLAVALDTMAAPEEPLARVGPYTLHEVLGRGGMGVVYRATQSAPLRREVALKLVRPGPGRSRVLARFEAERQTLARLDHPAIARVLDAGSATDGSLYFAMDLVRGPSITVFADERRLGVRQRLELFLAVCAGVQYAHQKGVIHRDLKPSNILVAEEAEGPRPRVIDFGIARALEDPEQERLTMDGMLVGTPEYMSPEHVGVVEGDVDTRTDVYALGVVLYEMLTGTRPHRFARLTIGEIQRVLGGPGPRLPSAVVLGPEVAPDEAARRASSQVGAARQSTPDRLNRQLSGDLDNVVLKALAREPDRRYASVEQLAADIRRHLAGRPVEARAATWTSRAGKFLRRHALAAGAAAALVLTLAASAIVTLRQSRVVAQERDRARREAETARQVSAFLVDLFERADPSQSRGAAVTVREVLDRGSARIPKELATQPVVRARLLLTMGEVYHALGLYDPASKLLQQALAEYEARPSSELAERAEALDSLGVLAHDMRDMARAEQYGRRALDLRRAILGNEHEAVGESLINLATALRAGGHPDEAAPLYQEGLAVLRRRLGNEHPTVAWALFNVAWALHQRGRLDEAEPLYREAADLQHRLLGDTHPDLGDTLNSLAGIYYQRGQLEQAKAIWEEALNMYKRLYGDQHAASARAYMNLGHALFALGDFPKAEGLYRHAVEINLALIGPDHPNTATTLHSHGVALWRLGRNAEAEQLLRRALAVRERAPGPRRLAGATLAALALVLLDEKRAAEAEKAAGRASAIGEAQAAQWPSLSASMFESLATVLAARRRPAEAAPLWRRALALRESAQDSSPQSRALARAGLGDALMKQGEGAAAAEALRAADAVLQETLPPEHPDRRRVHALWQACVRQQVRR